MSRENVELVKRAIAASSAKPPDADALTILMQPDHVHRTNWGIEGKTHYGVQGYLNAIAETDASWQSWRQDVERVIDAGENGVVVFLRLIAVGRQSGAPVDFPWAMVVTLRDGKIASSQVFLDRRQALEAVGLAE